MDLLMQTIDYFHKGGLIMYPLLLCSILAITIGVERYLYFRKSDSQTDFANNYCQLLENEDWQSAMSLADKHQGYNAQIMRSSMKKFTKGTHNIAPYLESESMRAIAHLRYHLSYLGIIVTLAPLLGLLGTILGMISSFSVFDLQAGQPTAITAGIGEALIATATGICVAVIALCIHAYFAQRLDTMITHIEECSSKLIEFTAAKG